MKLSTVRDVLAIVRDLLLIVVLGAVLLFGAAVGQAVNDIGTTPTPAVPTELFPVLPEPSPGECIGEVPCTEVPSN